MGNKTTKLVTSDNETYNDESEDNDSHQSHEETTHNNTNNSDEVKEVNGNDNHTIDSIDDEKTNEKISSNENHQEIPHKKGEIQSLSTISIKTEINDIVSEMATNMPKQIEDQKVNVIEDYYANTNDNINAMANQAQQTMDINQAQTQATNDGKAGVINENENDDYKEKDIDMDQPKNEDIQETKENIIENKNDDYKDTDSEQRIAKEKHTDISKWPRELGLNHACFDRYEPVLNITNTECKLTENNRNKPPSLLWFFDGKLDDHLLDRYNYHSFAITAHLIAYPLSYNSSQLRVIDRFYHRFAHTFHSLYVSQLRKQTSLESEDIFYNAIGGKDVSRRSLIIPSNSNGYTWIDLDGSTLVPSAMAGIQTNGIAMIFFIRIPDKKDDELTMKVQLEISDNLCRDNALYSSIKWHPTSAHTLLIMDRDIIRLYCVDTSFQNVKCVLTIPLNASVNVGIPNMIISYHYSFDSYLLMVLNGPNNKSYGLVCAKDETVQNYKQELNGINFINIYKFKKYDTNDPRRIKAKHLDDLTDYDSKPALIAHLSYEYLCETVIKFDEMHRSKVKKECAEIFVHCIMLQPSFDQNKSCLNFPNPQNKYFFATVSKCIGYALNMVTLWSFIDTSAKCVQRICVNTASVNTVMTSMEYNRYSKPYIILTNIAFDPFQTDYMQQRSEYLMKGNNAKIRRDRFSANNDKPIIFIDFKSQKKAFDTHMIGIDWYTNETLATQMPFVKTVLSKSDTLPYSQLMPCRSLYRFVESSLIGQKQELKQLKLYTRRRTIGLLRIGVFGFEYFELYTPESIKLRRNPKSPNTKLMSKSASITKSVRKKSENESMNEKSSKLNKAKKSQKLFYSRLEQMLSSHHSTFLENIEHKIEERLSQNQSEINERLVEFEQKQRRYESEIHKSIENNTHTMEALAQKWNESPQLTHSDMERILTNIISDQIMPKYGVYLMTMFKKFCNVWLVPCVKSGIEKAMVNTNENVITELERRMKDIQTGFNGIEERIRNECMKQSRNSGTEPMMAMLSEKANEEIADLVNEQLQQTLGLINKSLSSVINEQLQQALLTIQSELNRVNSSISQSFQNHISDVVQEQFKTVMSELENIKMPSQSPNPYRVQMSEDITRAKLMALQSQLDQLKNSNNSRHMQPSYYNQPIMPSSVSPPPYQSHNHNTGYYNSINPLYELQGRMSELMNEYQQRMRRNEHESGGVNYNDL